MLNLLNLNIYYTAFVIVPNLWLKKPNKVAAEEVEPKLRRAEEGLMREVEGFKQEGTEVKETW